MNPHPIVRFSIECRKTKTKVITLANATDVNNTTSQSEFEANTHDTCDWRQAWENACDENKIGLGLDTHWLRKSVVMQYQSKSEITFDTSLKTALYICS